MGGHYLTLSNAGRAPGFEARNEYDPRGMAEAIEVAKRQALSLIPHEHFHLCRWGAAQFMPVTWEVACKAQGNNGTCQASTTFQFEYFGLTPPRVPVVLSVEDNIKLELDLTFQRISE